MELEIIRLLIVGDMDGAKKMIDGMFKNELVTYSNILEQAQSLVEEAIESK